MPWGPAEPGGANTWPREELLCLFQCSVWGRTRPRKGVLEGRVAGGGGMQADIRRWGFREQAAGTMARR